MVDNKRARMIADYLSTRNWATFQELSTLSGLSRDDLIRLKPSIEGLLKEDTPDLTLTSRVDLDPPGFQVED